MTTEEFLCDTLIDDLNEMVDAGLQYYAFPIICSAVEVFGSLRDRDPIDKRGLSEIRFKAGVVHFLDDQRYAANQTTLYEGLRGKMVHQLRPSGGSIIASTLWDSIDAHLHLKTDANGRLIVLVEPLIESLKQAGQTARKCAERQPQDAHFNHERFRSEFLNVGTHQIALKKLRKDPDSASTIFAKASS
jgi:hypothetical protein